MELSIQRSLLLGNKRREQNSWKHKNLIELNKIFSQGEGEERTSKRNGEIEVTTRSGEVNPSHFQDLCGDRSSGPQSTAQSSRLHAQTNYVLGPDVECPSRNRSVNRPKDDSNAPGPHLETQARPGIPCESAASRRCLREQDGGKIAGEDEGRKEEVEIS